MKKKILFVINVDWFFLSHRLPIALEALEQGYDVLIATKDTGFKEKIESYGIIFFEINFERSGRNPFKELTVIYQLWKVLWQVKPEIIHNVTIKPSLYISIVCKLFPWVKTSLINAVSGLGYNFTDDRNSVTKRILLILMRFAFSSSKITFIFQNNDDLKLYRDCGLIKSENFIIIKGSGVDEIDYKFQLPVDKVQINVLFSGRILYDKGVVEFINAAKILRTKWKHKANFILMGDIDINNPSTISENDLKMLLEKDYIIWEGFKKNMIPALVGADIVCLPSYREGLPKSLIEAMAIGRPIVTTDVPGCRECVEEGRNGYLVPHRDSVLLAKRIDSLLEDKALRIKMGEYSRTKMVNELSLKLVLGHTLKIYQTLSRTP